MTPELLTEIQEEASLAGLGHIFPAELYPFPREAVLERWRTVVETILADPDGLGFAAVAPPWLDALYVRPAAWGTGVADRLHERALEALRAARRGDGAAVGAGGEPSREALLRAPRLVRGRLDPRRAVPASSARRGLLVCTRVAPGGPQPLAVAQPQHSGDDEERELVERTRDRRETEEGQAAEPARQRRRRS